MKPLYIFLHVVKTGGSTICQHMRKYLPDGFRRYKHNQTVKPDLEKDVFIAGHIMGLDYGIHEHYPDRQPHYIMVLRDPADWLVSMYHQEMHRTKNDSMTFEEFYETVDLCTVYPIRVRRNRLTKYVREFFHVNTLDEIKVCLRNMWLLCVTQGLDIYLPDLFMRLGVTTAYENRRVTGKYDELDNGVIKKRYELTEDMRQRIYDENQDDWLLYMHAYKHMGFKQERAEYIV